MNQKEHRLAAIMYTDIKGFSRMMEEDEVGTLRMLDYHNDVIKKQITENRGTLIKTIGDAVLAHYPTAMDAVQASIAIQMIFSQYNVGHKDRPILLRIGVHLGDIYFTEDDAFGEGINIAARLQSIASPGRVCLSREVFNQVDGKLNIRSRDIGRVDLKNITRIINAHELIIPAPPGTDQEEEESPSVSKTASEEAKTVRPETIAGKRLNESWAAWDRMAGAASSSREEARTHTRSSRSSRRSHSRSHSEASEERQQIKEFFLEKAESISRVIMNKAGKMREYDPEDPYAAYRHWRARFEEQCEKQESDFRGHLGAYLAVNGGLLILNMITSPAFPWFIFPAGGWGIGLSEHWARVRSLKKDRQALEKLPEMDEEQLSLFKKIRSNERSLMTKAVTTAAVTFFLFLINLVTNGLGFPWFLIPGFVMGAGFAGTLGVSRSRREKYRKRFAELFPEGINADAASEGKPQSARKDDPSENPMIREVREMKDAILVQLEGLDGNPLGDDAEQTLNDYVEQVILLSRKNREMEATLASIPLDGLEEDVTRLREKMAAAQSEALRDEYQKSIDQIEKQRETVGRLREQKEIVELRVHSAVNNMKQMNIDLARMKNLADTGGVLESGDPESLKRRSRELSEYIDDITESYKDLEY